MQPLGGEATLRIKASPEQVWELVSDVTRIGEFSPETFEARWSGGSTGPAVGATFKGHVRRNGVGPTYWSPCRVTKCDPERLFEFTVGTDAMTFNAWGYRLTDLGDGTTEVTEYFRLSPSLPLRIYWMALGRWRRRTNVAGMRTTLLRMKDVLEA